VSTLSIFKAVPAESRLLPDEPLRFIPPRLKMFLNEADHPLVLLIPFASHREWGAESKVDGAGRDDRSVIFEVPPWRPGRRL
jgi:hypothetical protein